jgi:hypothetical protein
MSNFDDSKKPAIMEPEKSEKEKEEKKLEKELKTLVLKMKNENTALNKILTQLKIKEETEENKKINTNKLISK